MHEGPRYCICKMFVWQPVTTLHNNIELQELTTSSLTGEVALLLVHSYDWEKQQGHEHYTFK